MKYICLLVLFFGLATQTEFLKVQVSAISNIKKKFKVMNQLKDFAGCEATRETLIKPQCIIEGAEEKDRQKMCDDYTKNLEKQLNCKDSCEDFYKKLNKVNIKYAKDQAKYFKGKKDKDRAQRSKAQAKDQKESEEAFVQSHCFADMSEVGDDMGKALEPEEGKKKK